MKLGSTAYAKDMDRKFSDGCIMKTTLAFAAAASLAMAACATTGSVSPDATSQRYVLKNGDVLLVDANGGMRMFDVSGYRVMMKDGTPMELNDGRVVVMKENVVWKSLRTRGSMSPRG